MGYSPWGRKESYTTEQLQFLLIFGYWASLVAQRVKHLPAMQETCVQSLGQEDPLEKEIAAHSSTLAVAKSQTRLSDFTHSLTHSGIQMLQNPAIPRKALSCIPLLEGVRL